jgi:hypothetical protein
MVITEEEFKRRLNSSKNIINNLPVQNQRTVEIKREHIKREPISITENVAGAVASITGHVDEAARAFGVSVSQTARAARSKAAQEARERVNELALTKLMQTLGLLTIEKMENSDFKSLAAGASALARVIDRLSDKESQTPNQSVQVMLYMPEQRNVSSYKVIDV